MTKKNWGMPCCFVKSTTSISIEVITAEVIERLLQCCWTSYLPIGPNWGGGCADAMDHPGNRKNVMCSKLDDSFLMRLDSMFDLPSGKLSWRLKITSFCINDEFSTSKYISTFSVRVELW